MSEDKAQTTRQINLYFGKNLKQNSHSFLAEKAVHQIKLSKLTPCLSSVRISKDWDSHMVSDMHCACDYAHFVFFSWILKSNILKIKINLFHFFGTLIPFVGFIFVLLPFSTCFCFILRKLKKGNDCLPICVKNIQISYNFLLST